VTRRSGLLLGALLVAAAAALRLFRLDHFSYGLDEIIQTYWIREDWEGFWRSKRMDALHPPLDYLVVKLFEYAGPADWARKLPAVLWGLGAMAALGTLIARRANLASAWATATLLAFAPFHVRFSQELRPYSLGLFLLCLSLLALDCYLSRPGPLRLVLLYLSCLATAYTAYVAAGVLAMAAAALLAEDAFSPEAPRQRAARRFLLWSPVFLSVLWLAYLPWWPVFLEASRQPSPVPPAPLSWPRIARTLSFYAFAPLDGQPLGRKGPVFLLLVAAGLLIAVRRRGLRFLAAWTLGGFLAIEVLGHIHPYHDVSRRFLPAGLAFPALAALPIATLLESRRRRMLGAGLLALVLLFDLRSLAVYYREGRADWRTLGRFLRARPVSERVFTENGYSALCVAFYVYGPDWLAEKGQNGRTIVTLDGQALPLTWAWPAGTTAWLVLAGEPVHEPLRRWSEMFPSRAFPKAERAVLRRLDPMLWGRMSATAPGVSPPH
jgi:hypothetical protein